MCKLLIQILFSSAIGFVPMAGSLHAQWNPDSCCCPIPEGDTGFGFGRRMPAFADMGEQLSPDKKYLVFLVSQGNGGAWLLDLGTLKRTQIIVHGGLPGESDISFGAITFCPYDPDLLALTVESVVDTIQIVNNLFTYRISTGASKRITPDTLGPLGYGGLNLFGWLPGSKPNMDTFVIGFGAWHGKSFYGTYVPQTQGMNPVQRVDSRIHFLTASRDRQHSITFDDTVHDGYPYFLDSTKIRYPKPIYAIANANFSLDGKLFAAEVDPLGYGPPADTIFEQVWVWRTSDPSTPIRMINFQKLFCKYSFWGIWPCFITDSTIAVSMHKDGDTFSPLWEITIDGRIVRQLTFLPQNTVSVAETSSTAAELPISIFPNPARDEFTVSFAKPEGVADGLQAELFDVLGRVAIPVQGVRGTSLQLDVSGVPDGVYYLRASSGGVTASKRLVIRR